MTHIMVRAENPGGRGRIITLLQNQGLILPAKPPWTTAPYPVPGLRVDEIGPIVITPAVYGNGIDQPPTVPAMVDPAYHANFWIVEPLKSQLRAAFTGEPVMIDIKDADGNVIGQVEDPDATNSLFQAIRNINDFRAQAIISGIKRPEGYMTGNNVLFYLPRKVDTPHRIWC